MTRRIKLYILFLLWILKGRPVPPPHLIKQRVVKGCAKKFGMNILVETGTYKGDMIESAKNFFKKIYSVELDKNLYLKAQRKFLKLSHVNIFKGDSAKVLPQMLSGISEPCLFWLDAHYSGGITAQGEMDTPILRELDYILKHSTKHKILIDDARCFVGQGDYPSFDKLKGFVLERNPNLIISQYKDIIIIY